MVFSKVESSITKSGQALGIFKKDWHDVIYDIQHTSGISNKIKTAFSSALSSYDIEHIRKYNAEIKNGVTSQTAFNRCMLNTSSAAQNLVASANGATVSEKALTAATNQLTFAQKAANVASKALVVGLNLISNIAFAVAINYIITKVTELVNKQKELRESISETAEEAKRQTDSLNSLIKSYEEFAGKISYTAEEKEKLKDIQEQLSDLYHTEVDDIDLVNGKYDEEIAKLKELKKEKLKNAELSLVAEREQATRDSSYKGLTSQGKNKQFLITADWFKSEEDYNNIINEFDNKLKYAFSTDIAWASKWAGYDSELSFTIGDAEYRVKQIQEAMSILKKYGYSNIGLYSELNDLLSEYQGYVDTELESVSNLAENMFQQYELDNPYKEVGQDSYLAWRDGLLATAGDDEDLRRQLLILTEKQFPDYAKYFTNLSKARSMFVRANSASEAAWAKEKDNFLEKLSPEDLEIATKIPDLFANGLDGATAKIKAWKSDPNNKITADVDTKPLEELQKAYEELSKSASSYVSNQKLITSALEEQEKYGQLSAKTIQELTDAGYAQALSINTETGAVTLNKQEYEKPNKEKKQAIILEAEQQKTDLTQKYNDESKTVSDLTLEMQYANAERRKAISLEISQHYQNMAEYLDMIDKINSSTASLDAPTFEDGKEEKPDSVVKFEEEYARRQHEISMGRMKEDEDYYNWLESAAKKAFEGLADYEDDLWKYEEEVYKGRKQLAEDYYNDRISDLESQIEIATKYSTDKDGNPLDTQEKFDYIRSTYQEILSEIDRRRNEIVQAGVEGNEDVLKELEQQYEKYVKEMADIFKDEVESEIDYIQDLQDTVEQVYDDKIDKIEAEKKAMEDRYDAEIDKIDGVIDSIESKNKSEKLTNDLIKARQDLEKANRNKRLVFDSMGNQSYVADTKAVSEAQQAVKEAEQAITVNKLEEVKKAIEDEKTVLSQSYDNQLTELKDQKEQQKTFYENLIKTLQDYINPNKQTEFNTNVWNTVAGEDGAVKVGNSEMSTSYIDSRISSEDAVKNIYKKMLKNSAWSDTDIDKALKNYDITKLLTALTNNNYKALGVNEALAGSSVTNAQSYVNNNSKQSVTISIGDVNITNPVGDTINLAKEITKQLPNAVIQEIYRNR